MAKAADGLYEGEVKKWGVGKAKTSSNLMFWVTFKIDKKVLDENDRGLDVPLESAEQFERNINRALTPNALSWLVGDLKVLGFDDAHLHRLDPQHPEAFDFEGKRALLRNTAKDKDGKKFEEWKIQRPREEPERPQAEVLEATFAILSEQLQQTKAAQSPKTETADIPF